MELRQSQIQITAENRVHHFSQNHSSTVYDDDIGFTFIISDNFGQSYNLRRENKLFNGFGFDSTNTGTSVPWITNNSAILTELTIQENGATEIKLTSMADSNNFVTSNINLNLGKILGFDWLTHTPGLEYGYIDEIKITSPTGESIYPSIDLDWQLKYDTDLNILFQIVMNHQ